MALADTARLVASLELQDKFSATANKFDRTVAGMDAKTQRLTKLGETIGGGARTAITNLGRISVAAGGLIAANVAIGVRSLAQLEQVEAQTDAVLKSTQQAAGVTADEVRRLAEEYENLNATVDDKVIQSAENLLLTFTSIRKDAFEPALQAALDMNQAMGGGESGLQQTIIRVGKALQDPIRGASALRRVGVNLTEQQEKQIKKLVESNRLYEAQRIILDELSKEFGGSFAAAGDTATGKFAKFTDAIEDAQQALATAFLPVLGKVADKLTTLLADPAVQQRIRDFGDTLAGAFDSAVELVGNLPWDTIGQSLELGGKGAKIILDAFTSMPEWVQTAVLTSWGLNKLTGGALGSIVGQLGKMAFGGLRGQSPAAPVFTREVGPGGVPGGGPGGGLGGGLLSQLFKGALGVGGGILVHELVKELLRGENAFTPSGPKQFGPAWPKGTGNVKVTNQIPEYLFKHIGDAIKLEERNVRKALKEGDIHAARLANRHIESLHALRGTVNKNTYGILPAIGRSNRALQAANRNLDEGNQRQRDIADRVRESREATRSGFDRTNAQLGILNRKDFSPKVNVTVPVTTNVSISDVVRQTSTYNVATSYASQLRRGFTPA